MVWQYGCMVWQYGCMVWQYGCMVWQYGCMVWQYGYMAVWMYGMAVWMYGSMDVWYLTLPFSSPHLPLTLPSPSPPLPSFLPCPPPPSYLALPLPLPLSSVQSNNLQQLSEAVIVHMFDYQDNDHLHNCSSPSLHSHLLSLPILAVNSADDPFCPPHGGRGFL